MSAELRASFSKVGFAVVAGVLSVAFALIYLGGVDFGDNLYTVETYYDNPVTGLSVGSDVNFRGVKVGSVSMIGFVGTHYKMAKESDKQKILVRMDLNARSLNLYPDEDIETTIKYLIRKGLHATVMSNGITGLSKIELNFPRGEISDEPCSWQSDYPYIPPQLSTLDNLSYSVRKVMHQFNHTDFKSVWSNISEIASSMASLTKNTQEIVDIERSSIRKIVDNLELATENLNETMRQIKDNPSLLIRGYDERPLKETQR
jgi:paraquat-inducible protein B